MAEYTNGIFGDSALFDEFENDPEEIEPPQVQKEEIEDEANEILKNKLDKLERENDRLKGLLRNLIPPRGMQVQNTECGPVAHVILMNTDVSRKYRQEVEEFFEKLVSKGECNTTSDTQGMIDIDDDDDDEEEDNMAAKPQRSSRVVTDEDDEIKKEAYLSTGNVQYYQVFCVDQLGRPLVKGDALLTGWHIPVYSTVFDEVLPVDETPSGGKKAKRPKNTCWNCDSEEHSLRECPEPRNMAKINANKQIFQSNSTPQQKRYTKDARQRESKDGGGGGGADRFSKFSPGVISDELREAIGIKTDQLPPYIYRMRMYGYPPGWMKEAEVVTSGMRVYNIKKSDEEGEIDDGDHQEDKLTYDPKKLVEFAGFNVPPSKGVKDEWRELGAMPMQPQHRKELQEVYMTPPADNKKGQKRRGSFMNETETKKHKSERDEVEMDMDDSFRGENPQTPSRGWIDEHGTKGVFKPPLPPTPGAGSPLPPLPMSTPPVTPNQNPPLPPTPSPLPPLPLSTPPVTPGQSPARSQDSDYTPMPSPGSSTPLGASAANSQESSPPASPTVEELEFQQKQLMEALSDARMSTLSSDTDGTSEAVAISTEEDDTQTDGTHPPGVSTSSESGEVIESPESPDQGGAQGGVQQNENRTDTTENSDVTFKIQNPPELHKDLSGDSTPNKSGVPRLSNFASGITPHVVESLSKTTGVFQKLLGILKKKK